MIFVQLYSMEGNVWVTIALLGAAGICHSSQSIHSTKHELRQDPYLQGLDDAARKRAVSKLVWAIEYAAQLCFYLVFPVLLYNYDDIVFVIAVCAAQIALEVLTARKAGGAKADLDGSVLMN